MLDIERSVGDAPCNEPSPAPERATVARVYRYGLLPPTESAALVRAQLRAAHSYRNTLVALERGRRAAQRELLEAAPDVATALAHARVTGATEAAAARAVAAARSDGRTAQVAPELAAALGAAREARRNAVRALGAARKAASTQPDVAARRATIDAFAADVARNARAHTDAYWGTYLLVEAAAEQSRRDTPLYDGVDPADPPFVPWRGEGRVGVQIQGGLPASEVFGDDRRLRVEPVDSAAWTSPVRGIRRRACRTCLRLRVGSIGRDPVWAAWPMLMHRPLPAGAVVKGVTVTLRRIGPREVWSAEFTVVEPAPISDTAARGVVAVDLGWRQRPDGAIRVARWRGDDGATGEVALSPELVGGLECSDGLRAVRDRAFDAARNALARDLAALGDVAPEWLTRATATLARWRSAGRLASLARRWRSARFDGDARIYDALEAWRYHDHHLWVWEASQRAKALGRRREEFRVLAANLAARYGTLVLEKFDLRTFARRPTPSDGGDAATSTPRRNQHRAAPSELRDSLEAAFRARGRAVTHLSARDTTRTCHACGIVTTFDAATHVTFTCVACGAHWDQDDNACANLLARLAATPPAASPQAAGGPTSGRWAKARARKRASGAVAAVEPASRAVTDSPVKQT